MRPYSQKKPFHGSDISIQGDSVRQIWGIDEHVPAADRPPLRRDSKPHPVPPQQSDDVLRIRLGEELDYVRRMLETLGDQLSSDPILIRRHALALQSLDIVGQILSHVGNVVRSSDPHSAVEAISMGDLRARLVRRLSL